MFHEASPSSLPKSAGFFNAVAVLGLLIIGVGVLAYMQLYEQRRGLVRESNTRLSAQVSSAMTMWLDGQVRLARMMAGASSWWRITPSTRK